MLPLSGEDGGYELRVRMTSLAKVADNRISVKRRATEGDGQIITVVLKEEPARGAAGAR